MKKTKRIFQLFQRSLKGNKAEEFFDKLFFRPISFIVAYSFYKLNISPNIVTILSGFSALLAFFGFYKNQLILGFIFFFLSYLFDLADGQVARLSKKSSPLGRILDGYVDIFSYICVAFGLSFYLFHQNHTYTGFILFTILGISQSLHTLLFDGLRNEYLCLTKNLQNCREYMLKMDIQEEKAKKMANWYNKLQRKIFKKIVLLEKLDDKKRDFYILFNSFLGSGTKYFFLFLGIIFHKITITLWFLIIITNIIFIISYLWGAHYENNYTGSR